MMLLTYPTAASWLSQYNQSKVVSSYETRLGTVDPEPAEQLQSARTYNEALSVGALLEANTNVPTGDGDSSNVSLDYNSILKVGPSGLMARIRIPKIDLDLPVYHGTTDDTLLKGIGHLEGTSLPVGGPGTRSVLTGHRGLANAEMFTNLNKVEKGDIFSVEVFGDVLTYQVVDTKVVEPSETEAIRAEPERDLMTLVTCTPLGINTHRILLTGERILPTPAAELAKAGQEPKVPYFPWWIVWLSVGTVLIVLYLWRSGYPVKKRTTGPGVEAPSYG
ncbi:MAG: class C sortase [Actinobacteria bacterium]|nr:MAG: class C sortase [Actinomycetota bacterium]